MKQHVQIICVDAIHIAVWSHLSIRMIWSVFYGLNFHLMIFRGS